MLIKQLLIVTLLTVMANFARSQFYVQFGVNLSNITNANGGSNEKNKLIPTFNIGAIGRFTLSDLIDLEPGVLLTGKGSRSITYFANGDYVKSKFNPLYLEFPLNAIMKFPLNLKGKPTIIISAGPYAAVGVAGRLKREIQSGNTVSISSSKIKFSNNIQQSSPIQNASHERLQRFDYGVNIGAGLDTKFFTIRAGYGIGLANINSIQIANAINNRNKYRVASISFNVSLPEFKKMLQW